MNLAHLCMNCMDVKGDGPYCGECGWREGTPADNPQQLPPRTVLDERYLIGHALGQGGFGITYLGWSLSLERKLAIKEYFPREICARTEDHSTIKPLSRGSREAYHYGLKTFADEGRTLARFQDHPGIVSVLDFFEKNGTAYIVMTYAEGLNFEKYLEARGGKILFADAFKVLIHVMDALREVHGAGMLHRDVSPGNIYITEKGRVTLLDFGSTRYKMREQSQNLTVSIKAGYTSWEQWTAGGRQGEWTDVYALGATFYRAITGQRPPGAPDRKNHDDIVLPSRLGVNIPPQSEKALMKALAVEVDDRFRNIPEFHKAIEPVEPREEPTVVERLRTQRNRLAALAGLLFFCSLGFLTLLLRPNPKSLEPGTTQLIVLVGALTKERDELKKERDSLMSQLDEARRQPRDENQPQTHDLTQQLSDEHQRVVSLSAQLAARVQAMRGLTDRLQAKERELTQSQEIVQALNTNLSQANARIRQLEQAPLTKTGFSIALVDLFSSNAKGQYTWARDDRLRASGLRQISCRILGSMSGLSSSVAVNTRLINPNGQVEASHTLPITASQNDGTWTLMFSYAVGKTLLTGSWQIQFWRGDRKIGEKKFVVY